MFARLWVFWMTSFFPVLVQFALTEYQDSMALKQQNFSQSWRPARLVPRESPHPGLQMGTFLLCHVVERGKG